MTSESFYIPQISVPWVNSRRKYSTFTFDKERRKHTQRVLFLCKMSSFVLCRSHFCPSLAFYSFPLRGGEKKDLSNRVSLREKIHAKSLIGRKKKDFSYDSTAAKSLLGRTKRRKRGESSLERARAFCCHHKTWLILEILNQSKDDEQRTLI